MTEPLRLHIGGRQVKPGWKILNIQPGPGVDFLGDCISLSAFADGSVETIYASHVYEHLGFRHALPTALREAHRVLRPGGVLCISVPDFDRLCRLFVHPDVPEEQKFSLMMHAFGAQEDEHDVHRVGLSWPFLVEFLRRAGFAAMRRVEEFGLFDDYSSARRFGVLISLNVEAYKAS